MKIAVLVDDVDARATASEDERGVLESVATVVEVLAINHRVETIPVAANVRWITRLEAAAPDAVFNLCEGVGGASVGEIHVASVVELLGLSMTGSRADTLALSRRKDRVNAVLRAAGLDVPTWAVAHGTMSDWRSFPALVKPVAEDGSVGIRQCSVVRDAIELRSLLDASDYAAPLLVQDFIDGREFNVAFIGEHALPIAEIDFKAMPAGHWPIVSYDAKWSAGSVEDAGTRPVCPASVDATMAARLIAAARTAWNLVGGSGYGRVDLRLSADGRICVLDVNPNPDLAPSAGLARAAAAAGWSYARLVHVILDEAVAIR